jgi:hypothetical protein
MENEVRDMVAVALLTEKLETVRNDIESLEILIAKYPFRNIDQRLTLRELQILYRTIAKSLEDAVAMFEADR